jgi:hypothetical protein
MHPTADAGGAAGNIICTAVAHAMEIRFISSLTPEDEARVGAAICTAAAQLLAPLSIAYTLRVQTTDGQTFCEQSPGLAAPADAVVPSGASAMPS